MAVHSFGLVCKPHRGAQILSEQNEPVLLRFVQSAHDNAKTRLQNQLRSLGTITIEEVYCIFALLK